MARHVAMYGVFIIESMSKENEDNKEFPGYVLKTVLDLVRIPNRYYYVRTKLEFIRVMKTFEKTDYFFLHLSCHGNEEALEFTNDYLSFDVLGKIMGPRLKYRRLFLSACNVACPAFAEQFIPRFHCYSVIGPAYEIDHDKAAIFWSSFYYLMYFDDKTHMYQIKIKPTLGNVSRLFSESINYYSIIKDSLEKSKTHMREIHFKNGEEIVARNLKTKFENIYWLERFN